MKGSPRGPLGKLGECHLLSGTGMPEGKPETPKRQGPAASAIFPVPQKRCFSAGELDTDLVGTTGMELHKDHCFLVLLVQHPIGKRGLLDPAAYPLDHKRLIAGFIMKQQIGIYTLRFLRFALDNTEILLCYFMPLDGRREGCSGFLRLTIDYDASSVLVQPVDGIYVTMALFTEKGRKAAARPILREKSGGLDTHQKAVVFV